MDQVVIIDAVKESIGAGLDGFDRDVGKSVGVKGWGRHDNTWWCWDCRRVVVISEWVPKRAGVGVCHRVFAYVGGVRPPLFLFRRTRISCLGGWYSWRGQVAARCFMYKVTVSKTKKCRGCGCGYSESGKTSGRDQHHPGGGSRDSHALTDDASHAGA